MGRNVFKTCQVVLGCRHVKQEEKEEESQDKDGEMGLFEKF